MAVESFTEGGDIFLWTEGRLAIYVSGYRWVDKPRSTARGTEFIRVMAHHTAPAAKAVTRRRVQKGVAEMTLSQYIADVDTEMSAGLNTWREEGCGVRLEFGAARFAREVIVSDDAGGLFSVSVDPNLISSGGVFEHFLPKFTDKRGRVRSPRNLRPDARDARALWLAVPENVRKLALALHRLDKKFSPLLIDEVIPSRRKAA